MYVASHNDTHLNTFSYDAGVSESCWTGNGSFSVYSGGELGSSPPHRTAMVEECARNQPDAWDAGDARRGFRREAHRQRAYTGLYVSGPGI